MSLLSKLKNRFLIVANMLSTAFFKLNSISVFMKIIDKDIKKNGCILIEGMWDNPHHWIRTIMLRNAIAEKYGSEMIGVYGKETKPTTYLILKFLTKNNTIKFTKKKNNKTYFKNKSINYLKSFNSIRELINSKLDFDYPGFYFYDGFLKNIILELAHLKIQTYRGIS